MNAKTPAEVIDIVTARKNGQKVENREPIVLGTDGAVARVVEQLVRSAIIQALQSNEVHIAVSSFLEGHGSKDAWQVHVTSVELDEQTQGFKVTGLRLDPVQQPGSSTARPRG